MSFDDIPEDLHNSHPCPNCENGNAVEDKQGNWICDTCDWCYVKNDESNKVSMSEVNAAGYVY